MKYTHKKLPGSQIELEVVLDHKEFLEYYQPVYDQALKSVHLKGFRPGTAPKELAAKVVDKEKVFEEAVNNAVRDNLKEITKDNGWQLIDQPKIEVLDTNPAAGMGLKYKTTLTIFPEIKLGNYRKLAKEVWKTKKETKATEEEITQSLQWLLNSRARIIRVNREAKKGDEVEIDFQGFLKGKNEDRLNGNQSRVVIGEGKFISGFEDNLINHKEGDNVEFSVVFPKDYWDASLREKQVEFKVHINGVFEKEIPELTDEFVRSLGKFSSVAELKNSVQNGLEQEKAAKEKERINLKLLESIRESSSFDLPKIMTEKTLNNLLSEYGPLADLETNQEELRKQLETEAEISVKNNLILYQIAKEEKLEPTKEEVKEEADKFLAHSQFSKHPKVDPQQVYDYIYGIVQNRKVFQFLENLNN
jgi:trigger factor